MLRSLPARRRAALEVGCGTGVLAGKLAPRFARVTGIDADAGMAAVLSARLAQDPRVSRSPGRYRAGREPGFVVWHPRVPEVGWAIGAALVRAVPERPGVP